MIGVPQAVIPAKAGTQCLWLCLAPTGLKTLDPRLRGDDGFGRAFTRP